VIITPKWWKNINLVAILLLPISILYQISTILHYVWRRLKQKTYDVTIICIGNRVAGGVGKTPFAAAISQLFNNVAIVSRGYGGANDEGKILEKHATVIVGSNRKNSIEQALSQGFSTIILDDGMQDVSVKKDLTIELIDAEYGYGNGLPIPSGPIRSYIKNADLKIVIGEDIFVEADYSQLDKSLEYIAFSGLGNNKKFFDMLKKDGYKLVLQVEFGDHHNYNEADIHHLKTLEKKHGAKLVTTEKDISKLPANFCATVPIHIDKNHIKQLLIAKNKWQWQ